MIDEGCLHYVHHYTQPDGIRRRLHLRLFWLWSQKSTGTFHFSFFTVWVHWHAPSLFWTAGVIFLNFGAELVASAPELRHAE